MLGMKTRTLLIIAILVVVFATGAVVIRGEGGQSIADWFVSMHGGGGRH